MNIINNIDNKIHTIINLCVEKHIIYKLQSNSTIFEVYSCKDSESLITILNDNNISFKRSSKHIDIIGNDLYVGISLSNNGYTNIAKTISSFKHHFTSNINELNDLIKHIESFNGSTNIDESLFKNFHITINGNIIQLITHIQCDKYIKDNIFNNLPTHLQVHITRLTLSITDDGKLLSIKLDSKHPNADKNLYYCLGEDKMKYVDSDLIDHIIDRIKIFNLNDCYFDPFNQTT